MLFQTYMTYFLLWNTKKKKKVYQKVWAALFNAMKMNVEQRHSSIEKSMIEEVHVTHKSSEFIQ